MPQQRLDKLLASTGRWSRKEARDLVRQGRVSVQNRTALREDEKYEDSAPISVDGAPVDCSPFVYLMLHKPQGLLSATRDKNTPTVLDLLPEHLRRRGLFPAGRLDKDTEGLLLITNDGPLAHALLSPGRHVDKEYECHLAHTFDAHQRELLEQGVDIGEKKKCRPAVVRILAEKKITLTITEGRFHQVKRMLHAVGNEVVYLKRIRMDRLQLEDSLEKGAYRRLTDEEVESLRGG